MRCTMSTTPGRAGRRALATLLLAGAVASGCAAKKPSSGPPPVAAAPTSSPAPGAVVDGATVSWTSPSPGATLQHCTTSGASCTPDTAGASLAVHPPVTVCAQATASGHQPSAITCAAYTLATGAYALPADRATAWNPGLMSVGGIPSRTTRCGAVVQASTYGDGAADATAGIQAAIDACPDGQVVQLSAGTFTVDSDILYVRTGITLRGAGAGTTFLRRTNGAQDTVDDVGVAMPVIIVGQLRWTAAQASTNLTASAAKGADRVEVASAAGLAPGMLVLVDERSNARWTTDPQGHGRQVWASPDWRTVWRMHLPWVEYIDDNDGADATSPYDLDSGAVVRPPRAMSWFSRTDRPTSEIHEIAEVSGNTVRFTTPLHIGYRAGGGYDAQLTHLDYPAVRGAGLEGMTVTGGDDGDIRFVNAVGCWAKNIEVATWRGEGFALEFTHRVEIRDSYIHDAAFSSPGGGAYAISLQGGTSECLIENNIVLRANKVIVSRCSGAGAVVAYNYMDQGFIDYAPAWQEMGVGGSHMLGPHHMLFEGNLASNGDNDHTHGSSIYHTYFRNHLTGFRSAFTTNTGISIDDRNDLPGPTNGPRRCAGASAFSYWMSFVGNVLGVAGQMTGWTYEKNDADDAIWAIGWEDQSVLFDPDPNVAGNLLRDGNYDHLTRSVHWHGVGGAGSTPLPLPDSLYLPAKPAFFGARPWPWVDAATGTTHTLPAKARFDAGTPNVVP